MIGRVVSNGPGTRRSEEGLEEGTVEGLEEGTVDMMVEGTVAMMEEGWGNWLTSLRDTR